jgi:hypothetical protein
MMPERDEKSVQETASVHEKTVQAVVEGGAPSWSPEARRTAPRPSSLVVIKLHAVVLEYCQEVIADETNGYSRYEIVSPDEAVVR